MSEDFVPPRVPTPINLIDYKLLDDSVQWYESRGYTRVETPWVVSEKIAAITMPSFVKEHLVVKNGKRKIFVGSGEQGFLSLINKGFLSAGQYQTITPCMRDDDFGPYHTKYFMKNELIWFDNDDDSYYADMLEVVIHDAMRFFAMHVPNQDSLYRIETDEGFDINYAGIELGSYGIRQCPFVKWVYGTGLALPRFTRATRNV
jgi:elongation factor P--beta-lysine ligase